MSRVSETDVCMRFITPALQKAGWDLERQVRREVTFTDGRIIVKGQRARRGVQKRADYILYYTPSIPIAIIEAKDSSHQVQDGIQQGLDYAEILDLPFVYSSNGEGFIEHDRTATTPPIERAINLVDFPTPEELWQRYLAVKKIDEPVEEFIRQPYFSDDTDREPRYYQRIAVNRAIEAIAKGQDRLLLVMATGTGKTYTAFQIIYRLWKAKKKKRILFLADRNILVDQTRNNDFKHFGDVMTKIQHRKIDKSYEVYLALYQALTGESEEKKVFKEFSPEFFDLIIVDECHRGSARDDSQWHEILSYFSGATQIGLTATPKETKYVSSTSYFGDPIYTYSLKQGIDDGFLAPYKVIRIMLDKDWLGWRPAKGMKDRYGEEIEDRIYNIVDYDRELVIEERTQLVAERVSEYLQKTDPMSKTIVFCEDIDHAGRMRQALINENIEEVLKDTRYVMKITGDDTIGKNQLDKFIDPEEPYPVIATTSKLMTTGVDAKTCKLIVLDKNINSMTEFKQIIGRGSRVREDYDKLFFTILDFRNATRLFYDPLFDGDAEVIYEPEPDDDLVPEEDETPDEPEEPDVTFDPDNPAGRRRKYYVNNVPVEIIAERVQIYDPAEGLKSLSLKDYSRENLKNSFRSLEEFISLWHSSEKKDVVLAELAEQGVFIEELKEQVGKDLDPFDLICHVAFDMPPLTRYERANNVKKRNYFAKYGDSARKVLEAILDKYANEGISAIEPAFDTKTLVDFLHIKPFSDLGMPLQIVKGFGGRDRYIQAVRELEQEIYTAA